MSERLLGIIIDSFTKILIPGIKVTIPLTVLSFSFAMVIAVAVAMIQFANVKVLKQISRFYIWVVRGTPLLVQLYVIFYGLPGLGIIIDPFPCAVLVFSTCLYHGSFLLSAVTLSLRSPICCSPVSTVQNSR